LKLIISNNKKKINYGQLMKSKLIATSAKIVNGFTKNA